MGDATNVALIIGGFLLLVIFIILFVFCYICRGYVRCIQCCGDCIGDTADQAGEAVNKERANIQQSMDNATSAMSTTALAHSKKLKRKAIKRAKKIEESYSSDNIDETSYSIEQYESE